MSGTGISLQGSAQDLDWIMSTLTIRSQCQKIWDWTRTGKGHFDIHLGHLNECAERVAKVTLQNYPDLQIPYHSRINHFQACQDPSKRRDRFSAIMDAHGLKGALELIVLSVLLDAGAGMQWKFQEPGQDGQTLGKSEGLALASLYWFKTGQLSANLSQLSFESFTKAFQISDTNPLTGAEGRFQLLKRLGELLDKKSCKISDFFSDFQNQNSIDAAAVLRRVQDELGPIWPSRVTLNGRGLGDVWHHPALGPKDVITSYVPFHKLSQWLSYSLLHAFQLAGKTIVNIDQLTGLPEYRNGGLFLDSGVLELKDKSLLNAPNTVDSTLIVEWRALTVLLLDQIAGPVRRILNKTDFPLPCVLEGGTWATGRVFAKQFRADGGSPIPIQSDGTVF